MISNRSIRKVISLTEYQSLWIFVIIFVVNSGLGIIMDTAQYDITRGLIRGLTTITIYWTIYGQLYLFIIGIVGAVTHIPYLLSLNAPRKRVVIQLMHTILTRAIIIATGGLVLSYVSGYFDGSFAVIQLLGGFAIKYSIVDALLYFLTILLFAGALGNGGILIGIVGYRFGWQVCVALVSVCVAFILFMATPILGLFVTGYNYMIWMLFLAVVNILLPMINYKLGTKMEVKS